MNKLTPFFLILLLFTSFPNVDAQTPSSAEEKPKVKFELAVDLLSRQLWHGFFIGKNPAIAPFAFMYYRNFTLELNGIFVGSNDYAESNINLHYQYKTFKVSMLNYIMFDADSIKGRVVNTQRGQGLPHVGDIELNYMHPHIPITLRGSMLVWGNDYKRGTEQNAYSTYIEGGYTFQVRGATILPYVSATPWKGMYADHGALTNIGIRASYPIKITDKFSLPVRFEMTYNTIDDAVYVHMVARLTTGIF